MSLAGEKVAVIGSGVSGLASAWLLKFHGAHVTLFEKEDVCGGHTLTDHSSRWPVDLGFQVYNLTTYPHFVAWMEHLQVDTEPSDMSFSLSVDNGALEWASHGLSTVFAQRKNLFSPSFLRMVYDVVRFGREAPDVLLPEHQERYKNMTLGQYLDEKRYSAGFRANYVLPMCAAVWSVPNIQVLQFPIQMLVRFWVNHHLLDLIQRPLWRVVRHRSETYVKKVISQLDKVLPGTPVHSVRATGARRVVVDYKGGSQEFNRAVLAVHSDTALEIRGADITTEEASVLRSIPYGENKIYLHTDSSLMPTRKRCWASWNFLGASSGADSAAVCVSYWVQSLQTLPPEAPNLFVTLNPPRKPRPELTVRELTLSHPVFSFDSWQAQQRVKDIQGTGQGGIYYAGAWCGYGFHEDGMRAAVAALEAMNLPVPWVPRSVSPYTSLFQGYVWYCFESYMKAAVRAGHLRLILPSGRESHFGNSDSAVAKRYKVVPSYTTAVEDPIGSGGTAVRVHPGASSKLPKPSAALKGSSAAWNAAHTGSALHVVPSATVRVLSNNLFSRIVRFGSAGLLQGYALREMEVSSLGGLAATLVANMDGMVKESGRLGMLHMVGMQGLAAEHLTQSDSTDAAYVSTELLFDKLGTSCYRVFLDKELHLTPALHQASDANMEAAHASFDALVLKKARLSSGSSVLELGTGWGALAVRGLTKTQCSAWAGVVMSKHQLEHATISKASLPNPDALSLLFADWRELSIHLAPDARHTAVIVVDPATTASISARALPSFLHTLGQRTRMGGRVIMLCIYATQELADASRAGSNFFREHVLVGAELPTYEDVHAAAEGAGLEVQAADCDDMTENFAATMREWRLRMAVNWDALCMTGCADASVRRLELSLALMEACLEARHVRCDLMVFSKAAEADRADLQSSLTGTEVAQQRRQHHMAVAKPVSSEMLVWVQSVALLLVGMLLNVLLGHVRDTGA